MLGRMAAMHVTVLLLLVLLTADAITTAPFLALDSGRSLQTESCRCQALCEDLYSGDMRLDDHTCNGGEYDSSELQVEEGYYVIDRVRVVPDDECPSFVLANEGDLVEDILTGPGASRGPIFRKKNGNRGLRATAVDEESEDDSLTNGGDLNEQRMLQQNNLPDISCPYDLSILVSSPRCKACSFDLTMSATDEACIPPIYPCSGEEVDTSPPLSRSEATTAHATQTASAFALRALREKWVARQANAVVSLPAQAPVAMADADQQKETTPIRLYGLNYNTRKGPDWDPERCKSYNEIFTDLSLLKRVTSRIRILSLSDCAQGRMVLNVTRELGLQLWLGLWVGDENDDGTNVFESELIELGAMLEEAIILPSDPLLLGVTVGSEAVFRGSVTASKIAGYKDQTKELLVEFGFDNLPVAIVDVDSTYQRYKRLFEASDVVIVNSFPFWDGVGNEEAADYIFSIKLPPVQDLAAQYGKSWMLGETGWPSQGDRRGASPQNQVRYFRDFYCLSDIELGWQYFFFTGIDNTWRIEQDGVEDGVEGHFGLFYSNLTMKPEFEELTFSCPGSSRVYEFDLADENPVSAIPTASPTTPTSAPTLVCPFDDSLSIDDEDCRNATKEPSAEPASPTRAPMVNVESTPPASSITPTSAPTLACPFDDSLSIDDEDCKGASQEPTADPASPSPAATANVGSIPTASPTTPTSAAPTPVCPFDDSLSINDEDCSGASREPTADPANPSRAPVASVESTPPGSVTPIRLHGLNYNTRQGPDWDPNRCKSHEQVLTDLTLLAQITSRIRILSLVDCDQGRLVLDAARALGLPLWLGLWVSDSSDGPNAFETEFVELTAMLDEGLIPPNDSTVLGVTVGSEAVYREDITASEAIAYRNRVKDLLVERGLGDLPVAIVDVDTMYLENEGLFEASDVVMVNSFPFRVQVPVDEAIDYLVNETMPATIGLAASYGKEWALGETGWSSQGSSGFSSEATPDSQAQYFQDFYCQADIGLGWAYFYFTGIDNTWRLDQDGDEEDDGHFGLFYSNLTLKPQFEDVSFRCPGSERVYAFVLDDESPTPSSTSPIACPPVVQMPSDMRPVFSYNMPADCSSPTQPSISPSTPQPSRVVSPTPPGNGQRPIFDRQNKTGDAGADDDSDDADHSGNGSISGSGGSSPNNEADSNIVGADEGVFGSNDGNTDVSAEDEGEEGTTEWWIWATAAVLIVLLSLSPSFYRSKEES